MKHCSRVANRTYVREGLIQYEEELQWLEDTLDVDYSTEEGDRYEEERGYRLYLLNVEADRVTREEIQSANDTFAFDYHTRLLADDWEDPWDGEPAYPDEQPAYPSPNEIN